MKHLTGWKNASFALTVALWTMHCGPNNDSLTLSGSTGIVTSDGNFFTLHALSRLNDPAHLKSVPIGASGDFMISLSNSEIAPYLIAGSPFQSSVACGGDSVQNTPETVNYWVLKLIYAETARPENGGTALGQQRDYYVGTARIRYFVDYLYFDTKFSVNGEYSCGGIRSIYKVDAPAGWNPIIVKFTKENSGPGEIKEVYVGELPEGLTWSIGWSFTELHK